MDCICRIMCDVFGMSNNIIQFPTPIDEKQDARNCDMFDLAQDIMSSKLIARNTVFDDPLAPFVLDTEAMAKDCHALSIAFDILRRKLDKS